MIAETLTLPAPIMATQTHGTYLPANASIKNPAKGKTGISHNRLFILLFIMRAFIALKPLFQL
jgi:hypothetical protein